jgi:hypothetical protein
MALKNKSRKQQKGDRQNPPKALRDKEAVR